MIPIWTPPTNSSNHKEDDHGQCIHCGIPSCYTDSGLWSYSCNAYDWKNELPKDHPFIKYSEDHVFRVEYAKN
jgi:hypothetical protein